MMEMGVKRIILSSFLLTRIKVLMFSKHILAKLYKILLFSCFPGPDSSAGAHTEAADPGSPPGFCFLPATISCQFAFNKGHWSQKILKRMKKENFQQYLQEIKINQIYC